MARVGSILGTEHKPTPRNPFASTDPVAQFRRALRRHWGSASKAIIKTFAAKLPRQHQLHDEGDSNRAIARELGWKSEKSVRTFLRKGRGHVRWI